MTYFLIVNKPKGPLPNKYHDQLWRNSAVIPSAWACAEIGSPVSIWHQCLRGRTESAAHIFWKNQHLTEYPEMCQKLYSTRLNQKFLVAMVATCSKSLYYSLLNSSIGE